MSEIVNFKHESATCILVLWDDGTVSLSSVHSTDRQKGHATELLNNVMRWVDDRGVLLKTAAEAFGDGPKMSTTQLVEFYKKFGFVPFDDGTNYIYMERPPK